MNRTLIKERSAWIPVFMSLAALVLLIGNLAIFGVSRPAPADEGTAAHIFQFLMGGQLPIIAFFAIKWLPKKPEQALQVLVLQFIAGIIAFAPVFLLRL